MLNWMVILPSFCSMFFAAVTLANDGALPEPSVEIASRWWPEFENVWTPVGWKDHFLRFNVLYNGSIVVEPRKKPYVGQGIQLTFIPTADGDISKHLSPKGKYRFFDKYGGVGNQGWRDCPTPVLWSEWYKDGLVLRTEIFGHIAGAGKVKQEVEPLYGWIRLAIQDIQAGRRGDRYGWLIRINSPHMQRSMWRYNNLTAYPARAAYKGKLTDELAAAGAKRGFRLIEDNKVRMAVVSDLGSSVKFIERPENGKDAFLYIEMPAAKGAYADLLLPILPTKLEACVTELKLGFERALRESNAYWSQIPKTAARVETPEKLIDDAIKHALKFTEINSVRYPETGQYCMMSGSWHYEALWITPTSMNLTMILDLMGYHSVAEKYLEVFRQRQGKRIPPGGYYKAHPGYLSSPKFMASIDWLADHGAILQAVCNHALVTDDREFIERWTDVIVKGCEFTCDHIASTGHGGVEGILPPAVATDRRIQIQGVWNDGWHYKGLTSAVRLLKRIGHRRAGEFDQAARKYKQTYVQAFRAAAEKMPTWTDDAGDKHHYTPTALPDGGDTAYPFYLDTGPLFLVYAGLMDADDPLMQSTWKYFREGPNTKVYDLNGAWDQPISLHHEMSSCEPHYCWNIHHAYQAGDRYRMLEGMYSLFAGAYSRQTFICCEHRGGISGTQFSAPLAIYYARLAVIDDEIEPGELHLLRLVPKAWLVADKVTRFEDMPTEYGPVSLRFCMENEGKTLKVIIVPKFRIPPERVVLHVPPVKGLKEVVVNGKVFVAKSGDVLEMK